MDPSGRTSRSRELHQSVSTTLPEEGAAGYEYQGSADQTRMRPNRLHVDKIKWRIADLFSLADLSYHPLSAIVHAYKLIRPAPKVFQASVFLLCRSHS
jgi:hypothetical protein